jgi:addiction module HigA family antidote
MREDNMMKPVHPGEHLAEFLAEMGISQYRLAHDISVPPRRINEIVKGKRAVTADTALRLGRYFDMSAQFWMNLQDRYELEITERALGDRLDQEVHRRIA